MRLAQLDLVLERRREGRAAIPLVEQLANAVARAIEARRILPGERIPSVRQMARHLRLSKFTVTDAYQNLVSKGLLVARRGWGYQVAGPKAPARKSAAQAPLLTLNAEWLLSEVFADQSVPIKAGCGWLPGSWVIEPGLRQALRALSRSPAASFGDYGHPYGHAPLRERIAEKLQKYGLAAEAASVLMTQGATQALDLVARVLLRPGDTVVVEDPAYCNLLQILKVAQLRVVGVRRTADGLDIQQLEEVVALRKPKALFVTSTLHNPTGSGFSLAMAYRVLQIAERAGLWVVEDDVNRELASPGSPMLAAMEGLRKVLYLGGFSKTISPALRVGYIAAAPAILRELARVKMAVGLTSSVIAEKLVNNVLAEGGYARHVESVRARLAEVHLRMEERFRAIEAELFHTPRAGIFLWARLPIEPQQTAGLTMRALERGIWLAPGVYFSPDDRASAWLRFNVPYSDDPALWDFLGDRGA